MADLGTPSASEELRALLHRVAAGEVSPDLATEAIARWMVQAIRATNKQDLPVAPVRVTVEGPTKGQEK